MKECCLGTTAPVQLVQLSPVNDWFLIYANQAVLEEVEQKWSNQQWIQ